MLLAFGKKIRKGNSINRANSKKVAICHLTRKGALKYYKNTRQEFICKCSQDQLMTEGYLV